MVTQSGRDNTRDSSFHLPDVTPVTLAASNNTLWLYLVPFSMYNIGIFEDFKLRKAMVLSSKNVFELQHSHSRVRFIKYIFFSFQKSFHMQHKKTSAQVIKTSTTKALMLAHRLRVMAPHLKIKPYSWQYQRNVSSLNPHIFYTLPVHSHV